MAASQLNFPNARSLLMDGMVLGTQAAIGYSSGAFRGVYDSSRETMLSPPVYLGLQFVKQALIYQIPEARSNWLLKVVNYPITFLTAYSLLSSEKKRPWLEIATGLAAAWTLTLRIKNLWKGVTRKSVRSLDSQPNVPTEIRRPISQAKSPLAGWKAITLLGIMSLNVVVNLFSLYKSYFDLKTPGEVVNPSFEQNRIKEQLTALNKRLNRFDLEIAECKKYVKDFHPLQDWENRGFDWKYVGYITRYDCPSFKVFSTANEHGLHVSKNWIDSLNQNGNYLFTDEDKRTFETCCRELEAEKANWEMGQYYFTKNLLGIIDAFYTRIANETALDPLKNKFEEWRQTVKELRAPLFITSKDVDGFYEDMLDQTELQTFAEKTYNWWAKLYQIWIQAKQKMDQENWERGKEFEIWLKSAGKPFVPQSDRKKRIAVNCDYFKAELYIPTRAEDRAMRSKPYRYDHLDYDDLDYIYDDSQKFNFPDKQDFYIWYKEQYTYWREFRRQIEEHRTIPQADVQTFEAAVKSGKLVHMHLPFHDNGPFYGRRSSMEGNENVKDAFFYWFYKFKKWMHAECLTKFPNEDNGKHRYPKFPPSCSWTHIEPDPPG